MTKENLQQYSDNELSFRVFNDEELYTIRHTADLMPTLIERFIASKGQVDILKHDLYLDMKELEQAA